jgi:hypothetical protein
MANKPLRYLEEDHFWEIVTMTMPPRNGSDTRPLEPSVWQDQTAVVTIRDHTIKPRLYTVALRRPRNAAAYSVAYSPDPFSQAMHVEAGLWPHCVVTVHGCVDDSVSHEEVYEVLSGFSPPDQSNWPGNVATYEKRYQLWRNGALIFLDRANNDLAKEGRPRVWIRAQPEYDGSVKTH